jgi:hypothetical protein
MYSFTSYRSGTRNADGEVVVTHGSRRRDGRSFRRARRNSDDGEDHECAEGGQWKVLEHKGRRI